MTDIVERLRKTHAEVVRDDGGECDFIALFREAAAEIERLRIAGRDLLHAIGHDREDLTDEAAEKMRRALEPKS